MGTLSRLPWWRRPGRARARPRARRARPRSASRASRDAPFGELSGGQRQRVLVARALVQDAGARAARRAVHGRRRGQRRRARRAHRPARRRGARRAVATHDVDQARGFDRVLCLNRRQIAFGPPGRAHAARCWRRPTAARSSRSTTATTARAGILPAHHHDHGDGMTDGLAVAQRALGPGVHAARLRSRSRSSASSAAGSAAGCCSTASSYSAESLAHGMFPGLVGASLLGLPLVAGGAVGAGAAAARHRRPRRRARHRPRHLGRRRDHLAVRARRAARADAGLAAGHPGAALRRRARASRASDLLVTALIALPRARAALGCCTSACSPSASTAPPRARSASHRARSSSP